MKKLCVFLAVVMIFASIAAVGASAFDHSAFYGDANADGKLNAKDVIAIMKALVANDPTRIVFNNADVNVDEKVNAKDVTKLMKYFVGDQTARLGHNDTLTVITPSTCVKQGVGRLTCKVCGDSATVSLPLAEHEYSISSTKTATCTKPGEITYTCVVCGASFAEKTRSLGHSFFNDTCVVCGKAFEGWAEEYFVDEYGSQTDERYVIAYDWYAEYHEAGGGSADARIDFLIEGRKGAYDVSFNVYVWIDSEWVEMSNSSGSDKHFDLYVLPEGMVYTFDTAFKSNGTNRFYVEDDSDAEFIVDALRKNAVTGFALTPKGEESFENYVFFQIEKGDLLDALAFLG